MPLTVSCLSACKMPEMGKSSSSTEKPTSDSDTENRRSIAMGKHAAKCTRRFYPMTFAQFDLIWHQRRWRWNRIVGGISIWRWLNMCVLMLLRRFAHLAYDINKAYRTREIKKSLLFEEHLEQKFRSFLTFNVCVRVWIETRKSQKFSNAHHHHPDTVVTIRQQNGITTSLPICSFCINLKRSTFKDSTKLNQTDKNR